MRLKGKTNSNTKINHTHSIYSLLADHVEYGSQRCHLVKSYASILALIVVVLLLLLLLNTKVPESTRARCDHETMPIAELALRTFVGDAGKQDQMCILCYICVNYI